MYTSHNDAYSALNSMEYRPFVGAKYHFIQNKRINIRYFLRIEERFINFREKEITETFTRIRNRIAVVFAISKPTLNENNVLYLNMDGEIFYNISGTPDERFINFFQLRAGPGYRFNYNWRLEIFYILQAAKKNASEIFHSNSHIAAIRLFYFIDRKENQ